MFKLTEKAENIKEVIIQILPVSGEHDYTHCGDWEAAVAEVASEFDFDPECSEYESAEAEASHTLHVFTIEDVLEAAQEGHDWPLEMGYVVEVPGEIEISKSDLVEAYSELLPHAGDNNYAIFVSIDGSVWTTHKAIARENPDWYEVVSAYGCELEHEDLMPGDDGYDYDAAAEWVVHELGGWLPDTIDAEDEGEFSLVLVDDDEA